MSPPFPLPDVHGRTLVAVSEDLAQLERDAPAAARYAAEPEPPFRVHDLDPADS